MSSTDASRLLAPGLLNGASIVIAGAGGRFECDAAPWPGQVVAGVCRRLGARVLELDLTTEGEPGEASVPVDGLPADAAATQALVVDGAALFAQATGSGGAGQALGACLAGSWQVTQAVAERAFLAGGRGGRIVYVTPPAGADGSSPVEHADAARAGLENLARTLSIEWARHGITAVAIAPGANGSDPSASGSEVAALVAYLVSPAGAYFSGCLLDLRGVGLVAGAARR
jgi:hypothetical protein